MRLFQMCRFHSTTRYDKVTMNNEEVKFGQKAPMTSLKKYTDIRLERLSKTMESFRIQIHYFYS